MGDLMKKFSAYIFDMDGVIFDSERLYMECCIEAAEVFGIDNIEEVVLKCIGLTTEKTHELYRNTYGNDFPLDDYWREATSRFRKKAEGGLLPVKDGARQLLEYLKEQNIPVALASSTRKEMVVRELSAAGLIDFFDSITGGDMVSKSKPEPDIFLLAAESIGQDIRDCAIIEDSLNGIKAARASGGYVIMVPDLVQPTKQEKELFTDIVLPSLVDLKELLVSDYSYKQKTKSNLTEYDCCLTINDNWFRYRAAAIIIEDGCLLLAGNSKEDYYYSVGGGVHMNETAEDAVIREVFEETGVHYSIDRLAVIHENFWNGSGAYDNGLKCHEIAFYYLMKPRGTKILHSSSYTSFGDKESMYWIPLEDFDNHTIYPSFLKDYLISQKEGIQHIITDDRKAQS